MLLRKMSVVSTSVRQTKTLLQRKSRGAVQHGKAEGQLKTSTDDSGKFEPAVADNSCASKLQEAPGVSRLGPGFFDLPCVALARALLGQVLARRVATGDILRGLIVETEAYLGGEDLASHSAGGRRTGRNAAMFMAPGTLYVYQIYGVYYCLNVSSQGEGAAVLLRALEPLQGQEAMRVARAARRRQAGGKALRDWELCNGPSKLCQALHIDKSLDRTDLTHDPAVWMEAGPPLQADVVCASRIGMGSGAGDWAAKPLRFYLRGNRCVSVRNRIAEQESERTDHGSVDTNT